MKIISEIESYRDELMALRRDIHAHPELAYEERRTAQIVADCLEKWGIEVDRGLAETGVVGTLRNGDGATVGLRADMDALPMPEQNDFAYKSQNQGKMHACGHDGHTAMLLGAARYLAGKPDFRGTVHFIFQPAEEAAGGAKVMVDQGLFERFPVDAVFGMHNWPGLEVGRFAVRTGPMMASLDCFDVAVEGVGTHGALPHHGIDPVFVSAQMINALQSIVSRNVDPLDSAVVSVTKIHAGDAHNIIPARVEFGGGVRCFDPSVRLQVRERFETIVHATAEAFGAKADIRFALETPAVVNEPRNTALAVAVAAEIVGADRVDAESEPVLGSEDFAHMLEKVPGCYLFIGNGTDKGGCMIHNPRYDFNDEILSLGATYWVRLAQSFLSQGGSSQP